jgi:hypothetical protein
LSERNIRKSHALFPSHKLPIEPHAKIMAKYFPFSKLDDKLFYEKKEGE